MEKSIITTGKTIEEAVEAALVQLGLTRDDVTYQVISLPKSGFFGIGAVPAKVQVTYEAPDLKPAKADAAPRTEEKKPEAPKEAAPRIALSSASRSKPKAPKADAAPRAEPKPAEKKPEDYTGNLVIYSPHDPSPLEAGVAMFQEKYPNINVEALSIPTGEAIQRIAAESENPQCDVLWGGGADTLAGFPDLFQPFVSIHDDVIADAYKDANDLWIGESPLPMCFIYNKTLIAEEDVPTTWEGLLDESLKGKIAYANPAKSGSAYTQLCTMLFSQPTLDEGWALVDKFIDNLDGKLQDGSSACHKLVATGEYVLGVTLEKSAVLYADNPDIGFVYPEKNSAVPDGISLIKNCPNQENAELFINFVLGLEVQTDQNVNWKRRPVRSDLPPVGLCALDELDLGDYDFAYAATEKSNIIEKWNDLTVD